MSASSDNSDFPRDLTEFLAATDPEILAVHQALEDGEIETVEPEDLP